MAPFTHHGDYAVVSFFDDVTWPTIVDLVDSVDTLIESYHYTEIELQISSCGGLTDALAYFLDACPRWSSHGLRLRTRAFANAESAAAVMLSVGHDRTVEPSTLLVYHQSRLHASGPITAQTTAEMSIRLLQFDERMIGCLVDRAMQIPTGEVSCDAEATAADAPVLAALTSGLKLSGQTADLTDGAAVQLVARLADRAVRARDAQALGDLYRAIFAVALPISPALARTLRLVDHIGYRPPSVVPPPDPCGLTIPEWAGLYPPCGVVPRASLTRHTLVVGETGSGKTASAILPVVAALARAPRARIAGALIVDPKGELGPVLRALAPERLYPFNTAGDAVLDLMSRSRASLDADLEAGRWRSAATRILRRAASFVPSSPAHVLDDHPLGDANSEFFNREGTDLALHIVAFLLLVTRPHAPPPTEWLAEGTPECRWFQALLAQARGRPGSQGLNVLALAAWALGSALMQPAPGSPSATSSDDPFDVHIVSGSSTHWLFAQVARRARKIWGGGPGDAPEVLDRILGYWTPIFAIAPQFAGSWGVARGLCSDFAHDALASTLYFGCEPGYAKAHSAGRVLHLPGLVGRGASGSLVLFQPSNTGSDDLLGVALKASFFEAVLADPDRRRGGPDLPLAAYISDEFHRFVTSDRVHGEQSYLDRSRSFGGFCVLACQSQSSLEHALTHGGGGAKRNEAAVSILWTNCATKLIFRTTDQLMVQRVHDLSPHRPNLAGVTRVRPVSTLRPGECYALLADGRFERRQLTPFSLDALSPGVRRPDVKMGAHPDSQP